MGIRKNIVISGASSGLGAGMAHAFAARGANLALCARRLDYLDEVAEKVRTRYPRSSVVTRTLDVNEHQQVFEAFAEFREHFGTLDRVIVNAGIGKGQPVGTGYFAANRQTVQTNLVAALAQSEAALQIFREQDAGHLVVVSSVSAVRGMPGNMTAYAAAKAGLSSLAAGIRADTLASPIKVTTLLPGYIESELTRKASKKPLLTRADKGVCSLVRAIEKEKTTAYIPAFPWAPLGVVLRYAPAGLLRKLV